MQVFLYFSRIYKRKILSNGRRQAQFTFNALKMAMTSVPILHLPDFSLEFIVETDASNVGIGVMLMQIETMGLHNHFKVFMLVDSAMRKYLS